MIAQIVLLARAYDAQVAETDPNSGSNAADDRGVDALESGAGGVLRQELADMMIGLNDDQRAELVALVWIGREDFEREEWTEALALARARREGSTVRYLLGIPLLGDLLSEGADALGLSLGAEETAALSTPTQS